MLSLLEVGHSSYLGGGGGVQPEEPVFCCFQVDWPKSGSIRYVQNSLNSPVLMRNMRKYSTTKQK